MDPRPRIVLGTAQLTTHYGIVHANEHSSTQNADEALRLLERAWELGIRIIETAPAYGLAERMIGVAAWPGEVWTKLNPGLPMLDSVDASLRLLGRDSIDVLFIHDADRFAQLPEGEVDKLRGLHGNVVRRLGISVYDLDQLLTALEMVEIDVVEVPFNVFDTRMDDAIATGQAPLGPQYVARSVFLQGALAQPLKAADRLGPPLSERLRHWRDTCIDLNLDPGQAALGWVLARKWVSALVVGAENAGQLEQILLWTDLASSNSAASAIVGENLWPFSDPRRWDP